MRPFPTLALGALLLLFVLSGPAWARDPGLILVYPSQGTGQQFTIRGRFIEDDGVRRAKKNTGRLRNLYNAYRVLESDEIEDAVIQVKIGELVGMGKTDDDGVFDIPFTFPTSKALRPGRYPVGAVAIDDKGHRAAPATGVLYVLPAEGVAVISDIDDTILHTGVTSKRAMLKNALLKNAAQIKAVDGAAEAYRQARKAGARAVFYLSGSPQNFIRRIQQFLTQHRFPEGPLLLKNFGTDPTFDQKRYKLGHLRRIFEQHPGMRFVLVGDSGERDPELYRAIEMMYPRQVAGILIRRVAGGSNPPERFTGMTVIDDHRQSPDALAKLVRAAAP